MTNEVPHEFYRSARMAGNSVTAKPMRSYMPRPDAVAISYGMASRAPPPQHAWLE